MQDAESIYAVLMRERARHMFANSLVTSGHSRLEGFNLELVPPWTDYTAREVLRIQLSSAGVVALVPEMPGVLLVQMGGYENPPRWEIPAGKVIKKQDRNIAQTASREFREETGLVVQSQDLLPLNYISHRNGRGGIQFMHLLRLPLVGTDSDTEGRLYLPPFPGALPDETILMAVEPLEIFMEPEQSLLRFSRNAWAYTGLHAGLREKFSLLHEGWPDK